MASKNKADISQSTITRNNDKQNIKQLTNTTKFVTSFIAGAIAGSVAKTSIAPLDRAKINFQSSPHPFTVRALIRFLKNSIQQEGLISLWRGNTATMARIVPYAAIQFSSHEQYKRLLQVDTGTQQRLLPVRRFLAGSLAGTTSVACTYPLDFVRARMAVTLRRRYRTLYHAFRTVLREEGVRALYRGFTPTMLGSIPYCGTSFFTYETLKHIVQERTGRSQPHPLERMCCGAVAGLFGQTASYPLDIVRRRMQTAGVTGHPEYTEGIIKTLLIVFRTEGIIHGWYKGLSMNWIKGPIAVGLSFTCFDLIQRQLRRIPFLYHDESPPPDTLPAKLSTTVAARGDGGGSTG